jgi:hypothetical protein
MAVMVTAGAGLAFSDLLSRPFLRPAAADPCQGTGCHSYWSVCYYYDEDTVCYPPNAYYGSDNCDAGFLAHYHKDEATSYWSSGGLDYKAHYDHNGISCAGRNAWIWQASNPDIMCSDGWKQRWVNVYGTWHREVNTFSICKTTI